jgi:hypothetical protein
VSLFVPNILNSDSGIFNYQEGILTQIGFIGIILSALIFIVYGIKIYAERNKKISVSPTWGCGYKTSDPRLQYTASSFVKTYSNLIEPILSLHKDDVIINEVFPGEHEYRTHNYDKLEFYLIDKNLKWLKKFLLKLNFLQNGHTHFYILYGLIFILFIIFVSYGEYIWKAISGFYKLF